jgi:hypothetical protein
MLLSTRPLFFLNCGAKALPQPFIKKEVPSLLMEETGNITALCGAFLAKFTGRHAVGPVWCVPG